VTDGLLTANDAVANNLTATTSKVLAVNGQDTTVARYAADWAARDNTKYLEFVLTPNGKFSIDNISAYLTTSGGSIGDLNLGYEYVEKLCKVYYGINKTVCYTAEGLDIEGNSVEEIMKAAEEEAVRTYRNFA
jgi:hypothetical protein